MNNLARWIEDYYVPPHLKNDIQQLLNDIKHNVEDIKVSSSTLFINLKGGMYITINTNHRSFIDKLNEYKSLLQDELSLRILAMILYEKHFNRIINEMVIPNIQGFSTQTKSDLLHLLNIAKDIDMSIEYFYGDISLCFSYHKNGVKFSFEDIDFTSSDEYIQEKISSIMPVFKALANYEMINILTKE